MGAAPRGMTSLVEGQELLNAKDAENFRKGRGENQLSAISAQHSAPSGFFDLRQVPPPSLRSASG